MWVRAGERHLVNLDYYQRLEVVQKESKWMLVAYEPENRSTAEGDATKARHSFAVLGSWEQKEEAIGHLDGISRHLKVEQAGARNYYDLRGKPG